MNGWRRVNRNMPCPVCGKPDWCLLASDGSAAICPRVSEGSIKQCGEAGYLHILRDDPNWQAQPRMRTVRLNSPVERRPDFAVLAAKYAAAIDMTELQNFAKELGVSSKSLSRLRIGWAKCCGAWSFPMLDADELVQGIRLRNWAGEKWSIRGSRDGLFLPTGLDFAELLLICEGATDTASMLDLGFEAVGRPSCMGGRKLIIEILQRQTPEDVVIVADMDSHGAGQRGAESLASVLVLYAPSVRVIYPPDGIKDVRAWKQADATHTDVLAAIDSAAVRTLRTIRRESR